MAQAKNLTAAMHIVADAIPLGEGAGVLGMIGEQLLSCSLLYYDDIRSAGPNSSQTLFPGQPVTWRSESSPAWLSPQQVQY